MTYPNGPLGWWQASDGRWFQSSEPPAPGWWLASDSRWYPPQPGPTVPSATPSATGHGVGQPFSSEGLLARGFAGFTVLRNLDTRRAPAQGGVYTVLRRSTEPPSFLTVSLGGRFKGKDPTVSSRELSEDWVTGTPVVYIGKATSLRARLRQYRDFGNGKPVGHWGGRYIWQLADAAELLVAWKPTAEEPRTVEAEMIAAFVQQFGKRPFANLRD